MIATPWGTPILHAESMPHRAVRLRLGVVMDTYPAVARARVQIGLDTEHYVDGAAVPLSVWPVHKNDLVILGYLDGSAAKPVVLGKLDQPTVESSVLTKPPYYADGDELANRHTWEWVHAVGNDGVQDYARAYASLVSWLRMKPDGDILFRHLQELPNPIDRTLENPPQFTRKYFDIHLDPQNGLTLGWPYQSNTKRRTLVRRVDEDGTLHLGVGVEGEAEEVALDITEDHGITLIANELSLTFDPSTKSLGLLIGGTTALTLGTNGGQNPTVEVSTDDGFLLSYLAGTLEIQSRDQLTLKVPTIEVQADHLRVQAEEVRVESQDIAMAQQARKVAFEGAAVAPHSHTVSVPTHGTRTTSSEATVIAEGADEVRV